MFSINEIKKQSCFGPNYEDIGTFDQKNEHPTKIGRLIAAHCQGVRSCPPDLVPNKASENQGKK